MPQNSEIHLNLIRLLEANPQLTQRELARELGVSLGKTNYCLKALADQGLIKVRNFRDSGKKRAYLYVLTPRGLEAKFRIMARFLRRKNREFELLSQEIEELSREMKRYGKEMEP